MSAGYSPSAVRKNAVPRGRVMFLYPWKGLAGLHCLCDAAVLLGEQGLLSDIFVLSDERHPSVELGEESVSVFPDREEIFRKAGIEVPPWVRGRLGRAANRFIVGTLWRPMLRRLRLLPWVRRRHASLPYVCIVGMDPEGLADATPVARELNVATGYWALELDFAHELVAPEARRLKAQEAELSRRADFTIIQDPWRSAALQQENGLDPDLMLIIPNAPAGPACRQRNHTLRRRFNLASSDRVVICAGGLARWNMALEVAQCAAHWPSSCRLLMHSHVKDSGKSPYVDSVKRAALASNALLSFDPLDRRAYREMLDGADIGLAFYSAQSSPRARNHELMGFSSGKLSSYLQCGLPVVVNACVGPRELVEEFHCGVCIRDIAETGEALARIAADYDDYSRNACRAFETRLRLDRHMDGLLGRLRALAEAQSRGHRRSP